MSYRLTLDIGAPDDTAETLAASLGRKATSHTDAIRWVNSAISDGLAGIFPKGPEGQRVRLVAVAVDPAATEPLSGE